MTALAPGTDSRDSPRVWAAMVTHRPEQKRLDAALRSLAAQVQRIVLVDNSPASDDADVVGRVTQGLAGVRVIRMGRNVGLGAAQNVALESILDSNADFVLLCDQDSIAAPDMVEALLAVHGQLVRGGAKVGCVCAAYREPGAPHLNRFQVQPAGTWSFRWIAAEHATPWIEISSAIASGSMMPVAALRAVGLMRADFFIDFIDTEWCLRARRAGLGLYGTSAARMDHELGSGSFRVWYGRWRTFSAYPAWRLRYRFRNAVLLLRSGQAPRSWAVRSLWMWAGDFYAHGFFAPHRFRNLHAMLRGIVDGLLGRSGPCDD